LKRRKGSFHSACEFRRGSGGPARLMWRQNRWGSGEKRSEKNRKQMKEGRVRSSVEGVKRGMGG